MFAVLLSVAISLGSQVRDTAECNTPRLSIPKPIHAPVNVSKMATEATKR